MLTLVTELTSVPMVILTLQRCFGPADIFELLQLRHLADSQNNYIRIAFYKVLIKSNKMQTVCISRLKTNTSQNCRYGLLECKV